MESNKKEVNHKEFRVGQEWIIDPSVAFGGKFIDLDIKNGVNEVIVWDVTNKTMTVGPLEENK